MERNPIENYVSLIKRNCFNEDFAQTKFKEAREYCRHKEYLLNALEEHRASYNTLKTANDLFEKTESKLLSELNKKVEIKNGN